jgi:NAD(P)-dependent dehydrogenase (short-subunit alcohol dehydrogenase family)
MQLTLTGRRALITGGGRGIGRAIALAFAQAGADVAVTARSEAEIAQVAGEVKSIGRKGVAITCDVANPDNITRMAAQAVEALGDVDILVNNAGMGATHKLLGHPDDLWHRVMAVNLNSVYYVTTALLPTLIERKGGRIINVASIASKVGARYTSAYSASKHGVLGLTRSLALEMIPYGITVNAICPGYVDTPMTEGTVANMVEKTGMAEADAKAMLEKLSPQGRLITSQEVAGLALYLASDVAAGITGQAINIDGGTVMF